NNYTMLLDKRLHARVAENVEKRQKGGKFRILDPASFPRSPIIPNKPKVLVLGFLFGCVVGGGLAVMRQRLSPQFRGVEDIELLAGTRLLAAIPDFSLLWSPVKGQRYLPSSYLQRRRHSVVIESTELQTTEDERLKGYSPYGFRVGKAFIAKLCPRSMVA